MKISRFFTRNQLLGLLKTGDVILPGTEKSPSFSQTGCIDHIDRMAAYLSEDDLAGLRILFSVFRWSPRWSIRLLMQLCTHNRSFPAFIGAGLRMLEIGLKGATMSLYYANLTGTGYQGNKIFDVIGWNPKIVLRDTDLAQDGPRLPAVDYDNPSPSDIETFYKRARRAQPEIEAWGVVKRLEFVSNLKEIIINRQAYILDRIQKDTGKSRTDALTAEIFGTLDHLDYLEKRARKVLADRSVPTPFALMGKKSRIYFEPLGTTLIISPWNYPFYQAIVPITLSFTVGNAVIYKPASATPLKGLVEELLTEAGFPSDWVQVVYGSGRQIGDLLVDQRPDKIFFIGSQAVGRHILQQAAEHLIPVELEMGGKDPMIVFEDVDLPRAVAGAVWGAFTNTGQSCTAVEKLFVHADIYERFMDALSRETSRLTLGTDTEGDADIGPMTTPAQVKVIAAQVADAREKGARFLTGTDWDGRSPRIPPMVIDQITEDMQLDQEETFGPLLPVIPFQSEAEVIEMANAGEFGLSASVWSADLKRADRVARAIVTGNVSINNVMLTEGNHALPFGGAKKSGIGRYKGEFGFYCFANIKSILIDKNSRKLEANWFPYTKRKFKLFTDLTTRIYSRGIISTIRAAISGLRLESYVKKTARKNKGDD
jgi:acyl-CoA reductase-like NAD-dependent aldehyde dehydrogenase